MRIRAGIIGGAGYTGGETIRLLINHPDVELSFVHSKSHAGKPLYEVHEDLKGETEARFNAERFDADWPKDIDVLFLCVGHGEAKKFIDAATATAGQAADWGRTKIIDLSQDFRLHADGNKFIYGLPELNREAIKKAQYIANPGCFATALQLGLLPLAAEGLLGEVYSTGITGSTGAGQSLSSTSHFSWRANNIQAYKTLTHQHLKEVMQSLRQLQPGFSAGLNFVPWRGDFTRGIFISSQLHCNRSLSDLQTLYENFYAPHPFTLVSSSPISLKQVVNTNKCMIQLEKEGDQLVVHSAVDNLLKGASGQAVQNMNLLFGLEETKGLHLKANAF